MQGLIKLILLAALLFTGCIFDSEETTDVNKTQCNDYITYKGEVASRPKCIEE